MFMELKGMNCPNCGAELHFTDDQDFCFCSHCGTQVYKDDPNKSTFVYREIDDAKIKEAEIKEKALDYEERQNKRKMTLIIILAIIGLIVAIVVLIVAKGVIGVAASMEDSDKASAMIVLPIIFFILGAMVIVDSISKKK